MADGVELLLEAGEHGLNDGDVGDAAFGAAVSGGEIPLVPGDLPGGVRDAAVAVLRADGLLGGGRGRGRGEHHWSTPSEVRVNRGGSTSAGLPVSRSNQP